MQKYTLFLKPPNISPKKREEIRWQYKGFAKIWENREEMAILKMLENGLC
jgi:hypothetical protein